MAESDLEVEQVKPATWLQNILQGKAKVTLKKGLFAFGSLDIDLSIFLVLKCSWNSLLHACCILVELYPFFQADASQAACRFL